VAGGDVSEYTGVKEDRKCHGYTGIRHPRCQYFALANHLLYLTYVFHRPFFQNCPGVGDDILHQPMPYFSIPAFVVSNPPANVTDTTPIDLVFVDYNQAQVLATLNAVQNTKNYTAADVSSYSKLLTNEVFGIYAQAVWN
jgi:hypothetical protein